MFQHLFSRHIHKLWGATGSFWQSNWDWIYEKCGRDNEIMFGSIGIIQKNVFHITAILNCVQDRKIIKSGM